MKALYADIIENFKNVARKNNLIIDSENVAPNDFGNRLIVFGNETLKIRVVIEKGQVFLDIASTKDSEWLELLGFIKEAGLIHGNSLKAIAEDDAESVVDFLNSDFAQLDRIMKSVEYDRVKLVLVEMESKRRAAFLAKLRGQ